jgi:hypothetical protein
MRKTSSSRPQKIQSNEAQFCRASSCAAAALIRRNVCAAKSELVGVVNDTSRGVARESSCLHGRTIWPLLRRLMEKVGLASSSSPEVCELRGCAVDESIGTLEDTVQCSLRILRENGRIQYIEEHLYIGTIRLLGKLWYGS